MHAPPVTLTPPAIAPRDPVILLEAKFAISEEGSGSITRVVQNRALRDIGLLDSETHELSGAIRALPALVEKIIPDGTPPTALAAFDFMQFSKGTRITPDLDQSVGSVMLGVQSDPAAYHNAQGTDEQVTALAEATDADAIAEATMPVMVIALEQVIGAETDAKKNGVTFSSNYFQFPSKVTVGCTGADIRVKSEDDESVYENATKPRAATSFKTASTLCIHVDGETEIPVTDTYRVATKYEGITDAAFPPPGGTFELAAIEHDGTTYRLPYLTIVRGIQPAVLDREPWWTDHLWFHRTGFARGSGDAGPEVDRSASHRADDSADGGCREHYGRRSSGWQPHDSG